MSLNIQSIYKPILFLTLIWILLPSCLHDNFPEEQGVIVVKLDNLSTRAGGRIANNSDEEITTIRIFVFAGNYMEKNELFVKGNDNFTNPFILEVINGNKDIYVVANESADLTPTLVSITDKRELTIALANEINAPATLPLLMTGKATNVSVETVLLSNRNEVNISLTRVAAKISLQLKKNTNADVKITKVSLLHNTTKTPLWEGNTSVTGQSYWDYQYSLSAAALELTEQPEIFPPVYLYENITDGVKNNAVQLEVEALYNNVPTKYRVYINENVYSPINLGDPSSSIIDTNDHHYSIKRNHEYKLTGTIKNIGEFDGLILKADVLPWTNVYSEILFERIYSITPESTPDNCSFTVDENDIITFTFTLRNPINAYWIANLSNPTDFELISNYQGVTDDQVDITIKAKNAAGDVERSTEFYINVGYGGHWSEIPMLKGTTLVGSGNRIKIKQPAIQ